MGCKGKGRGGESCAPGLKFLDPLLIFRPIDALNALSAQLTRDLFATAKFLFVSVVFFIE